MSMDRDESWFSNWGTQFLGGLLLLTVGVGFGIWFAGRRPAQAQTTVPAGNLSGFELSQTLEVALDGGRQYRARSSAIELLAENAGQLDPNVVMSATLKEKSDEAALALIGVCEKFEGREAFVLKQSKARKLVGQERLNAVRLMKGDVHGPSVDLLKKWTYDPDPVVRSAVYEALAGCHTQQAARVLVLCTGREVHPEAKVTLARMRTAMREHFDNVEMAMKGTVAP